MITSFLLLSAQAMQSGMISNSPAPPPAVIAVPVRPSPPPTVVVPPREHRSNDPLPVTAIDHGLFPPLKPVIISVRVLAGSKPILSDRLTVARANATTMLQRHDAPPETCPPGSPQVENSLTFQINRQGSQSPDEFFFGLSWSRPIDPCKIGGGLGQSVTKSVQVAPGQTVVVLGEGDLRIELSRP